MEELSFLFFPLGFDTQTDIANGGQLPLEFHELQTAACPKL
jgi:hypothetical protein